MAPGVTRSKCRASQGSTRATEQRRSPSRVPRPARVLPAGTTTTGTKSTTTSAPTTFRRSSCSSGTAVGVFGDPDGLHAWVASSAPAPSLNADETICNGTYAGTGDHVIVPASATCTLVPSTHVTGDVTVSNGGTLYASGVKIGGVLTI